MMYSGLSGFVSAGTALGLVVLWTGSSPESSVAVAGPLLLAASTNDDIGLRGQLLWILGAAVTGGGLGYGIAMLAAPTATPIALGFGIAVGGGLGAVARLFAVGETDAQPPDTVTVSSASNETSVPDPQPVDLFEENPDPVLYFDDSGDGPVVRAANPAFEETFGVGGEAVENAALADALMLSEQADDIVTAASQARAADAVVACETPDGIRSFRVRTVALARGGSTRGYVVYTPTEHDA
ncbi:PAS domain-containing protein [Salinibaculum salinum]|uniref:PAS domain-containing protein n=1 Tax=Salinibaculum salinum TaxID=3131996 RepID=UPI0030EBD904